MDYELLEAVWFIFKKGVIAAIGAIALLLIFWAFCAYLKTLTGHKLGISNQSDWQAYVPFALDFYRVKMTGEPAWRMVFFGSSSFVILMLISSIKGSLFYYKGLSIFLTVIEYIFIAAALVFRIIHFQKLYDKLGYRKVLAVLRYIPILSLAVYIVDLIIAVDSRVFVETAKPGGGHSGRGDGPNPPVPGPDPRPSGKITCTVGGSGTVGRSFSISDGEVKTIGRDPKMCNVVIPESQHHVSRRHCSIRFDANDVINPYVVSCYSKNGVLYGSGQIIGENEVRRLPRGTIISLGSEEDKFILN